MVGIDREVQSYPVGATRMKERLRTHERFRAGQRLRSISPRFSRLNRPVRQAS
jgi:hypothetical protein